VRLFLMFMDPGGTARQQRHPRRVPGRECGACREPAGRRLAPRKTADEVVR